MSSASFRLPRIAIIGGGPAGLTLCRLLLLHRNRLLNIGNSNDNNNVVSVNGTLNGNVGVTVYEGDVALNARDEGGSLDLHEDTGLRAMREAELMQEFNKFARPDDDQIRFYDKHANLHFDDRTYMQQMIEEHTKTNNKNNNAEEASAPSSSSSASSSSSSSSSSTTTTSSSTTTTTTTTTSDNNDRVRRPAQPEIDRLDLRRLLIESIPVDNMKWNHKLKSIENIKINKSEQGEEQEEYKLLFTNGDTAIADIVVGCDGAFSLVRSALCAALPSYTGVSYVDMLISSCPPRSVREFVGDGLCFTCGDDKAIIAQVQSKGKMRVYVNLRVSEEWLNRESDSEDGGAYLKADVHVSSHTNTDAGTNDTNAESHTTTDPRLARLIKQHFSDWDTRITSLLTLADPHSVRARRMYTLPIGFRYTRAKANANTNTDSSTTSSSSSSGPVVVDRDFGVTLVGDAAHVMPPFAGEGVNSAMRDATELALAIAKVEKAAHGSQAQVMQPYYEAIAVYEQAMFDAATPHAQRSCGNLDRIFHKDAPAPIVQGIKKRFQDGFQKAISAMAK